MKARLAPFLVLAALLTAPLAARNAPADERAAVAFLLAFGRTPAPDDAGQPTAGASVEDLLAAHRERLQADAGLRRQVAVRAWEDTFGRAPASTEEAPVAGPAEGPTYTERMRQNLQRLAANAAEYEQVIDRAYRLVVRRGVYPAEIAYWKKRGVLPYVLLVGAVEDWGRRNAPGLMETTGTPTISVNSTFLTTLRLSPEVAAEARVAAGFGARGPDDPQTAAGHNLVAVGSEHVVTGGRMHFAAVGADLLAPPAS